MSGQVADLCFDLWGDEKDGHNAFFYTVRHPSCPQDKIASFRLYQLKTGGR
jgi:hypothetical protein